jgi:hypothetical protein
VRAFFSSLLFRFRLTVSGAHAIPPRCWWRRDRVLCFINSWVGYLICASHAVLLGSGGRWPPWIISETRDVPSW